MTRTHGTAAGFSLIELVIAMAIFGAAVIPVLYIAGAGQRLARSQPEATDLQQRLRVATDKLRRDLAVAGAGPRHGLPQTLSAYIAPIVPARRGLRAPDGELAAFPDRLTLVYGPDDGWEVRVREGMASVSSGLRVDPESPGCPEAGLCGFDEGQRALVADLGRVGAGYDLFTVTGIAGELAHDAPNPPFSRAYEAGAVVMPIVQRVYVFDRATRRLMLYDGYQSEMPLVDNVVDVRFEYFGIGPGGTGLQAMPLTELTDGPVVGLSPHRFDADLLRIRLVRVTLRLQAAGDEVRGAGAWFARPGRSTSAYSFVPDVEVTFDVAPRNAAAVGGVP